jgi:pre-mRNA-splicing helicase BRR2
MMNELCWERVLQQAGKNQVLVFVHSRKDTAVTARYLRDKAQETDSLHRFVPPTSGSMAILLDEAKAVVSQDLKDLIPTGFGIHHAGLSVGDRRLVEDLFAEGHLQILVSTATLAWVTALNPSPSS